MFSVRAGRDCGAFAAHFSGLANPLDPAHPGQAEAKARARPRIQCPVRPDSGVGQAQPYVRENGEYGYKHLSPKP